MRFFCFTNWCFSQLVKLFLQCKQLCLRKLFNPPICIPVIFVFFYLISFPMNTVMWGLLVQIIDIALHRHWPSENLIFSHHFHTHQTPLPCVITQTHTTSQSWSYHHVDVNTSRMRMQEHEPRLSCIQDCNYRVKLPAFFSVHFFFRFCLLPASRLKTKKQNHAPDVL